MTYDPIIVMLSEAKHLGLENARCHQIEILRFAQDDGFGRVSHPSSLI